VRVILVSSAAMTTPWKEEEPQGYWRRRLYMPMWLMWVTIALAIIGGASLGFIGCMIYLQERNPDEVMATDQTGSLAAGHHTGQEVAVRRAESFSRKKRLMLESVVRMGAFKKGGNFRLTGQTESPYYIDCKKAVYDAEVIQYMADCLGYLISPHQFDCLGCPEGPASCALVGALLANYRWPVTLKGFCVRKELKSHGIAQWVEGEVRHTPIIVDDVGTAGTTMLHAISKMPVKPTRAFLLFDREEGIGAALAQVGVPLESVATLTELEAVYSELTGGRIDG
jgi:orotate phosphoribosyltransferase